MKKFLKLFIFLFIFGCVTTKGDLWCGDHKCINKNEQEAYFKKNMIVEIKEIKKDEYKKDSEIQKIIIQAKIDEKKRIQNEKDLAKQAKLEKKRKKQKEKDLAKQAKLDEKQRIQDEKDLAKKTKLDEKRRAQDEKDLAKQIKLEEKRRTQKNKDLVKQISSDEKAKLNKKKINKEITKKSNDNDSNLSIGKIRQSSSDFNKLVEQITTKNSLRKYPDINDIPE